MKKQLQEALVAAKNGREETARLILAQFLRDEPDNVPAWVLLSKLATSEAQKAAFLRKVLDLEPDHAYAQQALADMEPASQPGAEGVPETGVVPQAEEPEDLDWLDDTGPAEPAGAELEPEPAAEPTAGYEEEELPADEVTDEADFFSFEEEDLAEEALAATLEEADTERTLPAADAPQDFEAQMHGDTLPPWLPEDEVEPAETMPAAEETGEEVLLPQWLKDEADEEWPEEADDTRAPGSLPEEEARRAAEQEAELAEAMERPSPSSGSRSPWFTVALLAVVILLFLLLAYAALSFL